VQTHSVGIDDIYRRICKEVGLYKKHIVFPIFVQEQGTEIHCIDAMPEMTITPLSEITSQVQKVLDTGISSIIIFGIPKQRDHGGSYASRKNGIIQRALLMIKDSFGSSISVTTDVCLCQYNFSGH